MAKKDRKKNDTPPDEKVTPLFPAEDGETPDLPEEPLISRKDVRKAAFSFISAVILFAACILLWVYRDKFDADRLMILSTGKAVEAKAEYVLDAGAGQVYATAGSGLAVAASSGIELMDANGNISVSYLFKMETPAIAAGSDFAVFYDLGGTAMAVAGFDGSVKEMTAPGVASSCPPRCPRAATPSSPPNTRATAPS